MRPFRLASCLLVVAAILASGCGATSTSSTTTSVSTSVSTGASGSSSPPTATQGTSSAEAARRAKAGEPAGAKTAPGHQGRAAEAKREAEHSTPEEIAQATAPGGGFLNNVQLKKRYPVRAQREFIAKCERGKGSTPACECIVAKLELSPVDKGQSLAEMLAIEVALDYKKASMSEVFGQRVRLPRPVQRVIKECQPFQSAKPPH